MVARVQILPPPSESEVTQLQEDVRRRSWALAMDGWWLTRRSSALWQVLFLILLGVHVKHPPHMEDGVMCAGDTHHLVGDTKVFSQAYILISQACKKKSLMVLRGL